MNDTILIRVTNPTVFALLEDLEKLNFIELLEMNEAEQTEKLSAKYLYMFTKENARSLDDHVETMRNEWDQL